MVIFVIFNNKICCTHKFTPNNTVYILHHKHMYAKRSIKYKDRRIELKLILYST